MTPPAITPDEFARLTDDEQYERMRNAATFADIPRDELPWEDVRLALKLRALSGHDCYAYQGASLTELVNALNRNEELERQWIIWDRQSDPAIDARFTPRQWAINNGYLTTSQEGA